MSSYVIQKVVLSDPLTGFKHQKSWNLSLTCWNMGGFTRKHNISWIGIWGKLRGKPMVWTEFLSFQPVLARRVPWLMVKKVHHHEHCWTRQESWTASYRFSWHVLEVWGSQFCGTANNWWLLDVLLNHCYSSLSCKTETLHPSRKLWADVDWDVLYFAAGDPESTLESIEGPWGTETPGICRCETWCLSKRPYNGSKSISQDMGWQGTSPKLSSEETSSVDLDYASAEWCLGVWLSQIQHDPRGPGTSWDLGHRHDPGGAVTPEAQKDRGFQSWV